jgi:cytochrome P450
MQSGHLHHELHKMHQKYGPIVRIAPDELSYIDSCAINDIYGTHHGHASFIKNNVWAKQDESKTPASIVSWDEPTHLRNRRALTGAFTEHAVTEYAPILETLVGTMIGKFRERIDAANGRTTVNMVEWLNWLLFDISGALSFGESFDSVKNGSAHPWVSIRN